MSPPVRRDLLAAAWWSASLGTQPTLSLLARWRTPVVIGAAGVALGGCAGTFTQQDSEPELSALEQQEEAGWNVGGEGRPLVFPSAQANDVSGGAGWRDALTTLTPRLAPADPRWAPSYNPTLFQSLESARNADLREVIGPVFTPEMALAARRGEALRTLLQGDGVCRHDVAVVLDLPGPEAVAVAAALAPCFDPVFELGNWPHPLGVVPAHVTLASALYYLPAFEQARAARPVGAPPMFVLDRQRMAHYIDDANQFDNRYLVGLPAGEALRVAGVSRILYVTPDDHVFFEADDLNDDLAAAAQGGLDVKMLALSDFAEAPLPDWPSLAPCGPVVAASVGPPGSAPLYFGGSPGAQSCFAAWYGWQSLPAAPPSQALSLVDPAPSLSFSVSSPPASLLPRCHFHPTPRATLPFAMSPGGTGGGWHPHGGGGGWHPHGGGHFGGFFGRSGSLGRAHGGFSA